MGSNAYQQPWLNESLTNWSSAYYMDEVAGPDAGLLARDIFIGFPYRNVLAQGDERLDAPVDAFNEEEYSAIVYGKGALMYDVLRSERSATNASGRSYAITTALISSSAPMARPGKRCLPSTAIRPPRPR